MVLALVLVLVFALGFATGLGCVLACSADVAAAPRGFFVASRLMRASSARPEV